MPIKQHSSLRKSCFHWAYNEQQTMVEHHEQLNRLKLISEYLIFSFVHSDDRMYIEGFVWLTNAVERSTLARMFEPAAQFFETDGKMSLILRIARSRPDYFEYGAIPVPDYIPGPLGVWYCGPSGSGVTLTAGLNYPFAYEKSKDPYWESYCYESNIILTDLTHVHEYLASWIYTWVNNYAFLARVRGGQHLIRPRRVIITSNMTPEQLFTVGGTPAHVRRFILANFTVVRIAPMLMSPVFKRVRYAAPFGTPVMLEEPNLVPWIPPTPHYNVNNGLEVIAFDLNMSPHNDIPTPESIPDETVATQIV